MLVLRKKERGLVLNEGEIVLDEAHVVAFAAATEIAFSMDEVRNAPHHQDRK